METIIIPKKLLKEKDVVLVPRKEYEELLERKKFYDELDKDLNKAIDDYRKGKAIGPFETVADMRKSLEK